MKIAKRYIHNKFNRSGNTSSTDSILGFLYQKILDQMGFGEGGFEAGFNRCMEYFLADPRNGIPANIKERSSARGNIRKELLRGSMTWKVFCKGIRFLQVPRFTITICLHHRNGDKSFHEHTVVIDELYTGPEDQS